MLGTLSDDINVFCWVHRLDAFNGGNKRQYHTLSRSWRLPLGLRYCMLRNLNVTQLLRVRNDHYERKILKYQWPRPGLMSPGEWAPTQTLVFTETAGRQPGWGHCYLRSSCEWVFKSSFGCYHDKFYYSGPSVNSHTKTSNLGSRRLLWVSHSGGDCLIWPRRVCAANKSQVIEP